nr:SDR family oxidoreductase [Sphingobium lactosutens]
MKDKIALITGAGSGVGRACMNLFSENGATVIGVGRTRSSLEETMAPIRARGRPGMIIAADLVTDDGADRAVAEAIARFGRIDILIHAAGVGYSWEQTSPGSMRAIDQTTPDKWREVIGINLDAAYLIARAVIPHMRDAGGGAIVMIGSNGALRGMTDCHSYGAAKAALISLVQSMAVTYAKDKIRTNCLAPGAIDTPMIAEVIDHFRDSEVAKGLCPLARAAAPEEIAYGCLYLASDEAAYCTGSTLVIDGGVNAQFALPQLAG